MAAKFLYVEIKKGARVEAVLAELNRIRGVVNIERALPDEPDGSDFARRYVVEVLEAFINQVFSRLREHPEIEDVERPVVRKLHTDR